MTRVKILTLVYGSAAGKDYKTGEIAELPTEEAQRAVDANVAEYVGAAPAPTAEAEDEGGEFGGEPVATPTKKTGKGR